MKTAQFKMPDGRIAEFSMPDDATPEQAQEVFSAWIGAQQAPEPSLLQRASNLITGRDRETATTRALPELLGVTGSDSVLEGTDASDIDRQKLGAALLTMTDPTEIALAIKKIGGPAIGITQDEKGNIAVHNNDRGISMVVNKPGLTGRDVLSGLGLAAAFTPVGRATQAAGLGTLGTAAALGAGSAATQAIIEQGQEAAGGTFDTGEVGAAGALGAATPLAGAAVGSVADIAKRGAQALRSQPGAESEIVKAAQAANVPLLTSDVIEASTPAGQLAQRVGERIPYAGTGGIRAEQQEARKEAIRTLGERYAMPKPEEIVSSLRAQSNRIKQAAGERYNTIIPKIDGAGPLQLKNTETAIDNALSSLQKPGVATSQEAIAEVEKLREILREAPQTYSTLKENRTALREAIDSFDSPLRSQMPSRAKGLLNTVYSAMKKDMDDAAAMALSPQDASKLKQADAIYAEEFKKLQKTRIKNVLDKGDYTPEVAENLLFSKKPSEVRALYNAMGSDGRAAARAATIQKAIKDAGGLDEVSPEKFITAMNKLQTTTGIVFKGDDAKQLRGLMEVLKATKRAGQTNLTSTGQESTMTAIAAGLGSWLGDFGATATTLGTAGGLARAYESAPVRNALIRISSAPNSQEGRRLALSLARDLNASLQSMRAQSVSQETSQGQQ